MKFKPGLHNLLTILSCIFLNVSAFHKEIDGSEKFVDDFVAKPMIDSKDIEAGIKISLEENAVKVKRQQLPDNTEKSIHDVEKSASSNVGSTSEPTPASTSKPTQTPSTTTTSKPTQTASSTTTSKLTRATSSTTTSKLTQSPSTTQKPPTEKPVKETKPTTSLPTTIHTTIRRQNLENTSKIPPESLSPSASPGTTVRTTTEAQVSSTTEEIQATTEELTTSVPPPAHESGKSTKGFFCLCDYQVKECDMNCCCDPDCHEKEKRLFTHCADNSLIYDPSNSRNTDHSCFKSYIMYHENIPYKIDRTDKNLFCVAKENVRQREELSQADIDEISRRISHGKINSRPKYTWDTFHVNSKHSQFYTSEPYKYGDAIWSVRKDDPKRSVNMLRLPTSYHTDLCSLLEPVKYLQDSTASCVRHLGNLKAECETRRELDVNHFINDVEVLLNPGMVADNTSDIIPASLCRNSYENCEEFSMEPDTEEEFPTPKLEGFILSDHCSNVLSQLNLTIIHDGVNGILKVFAKALLKDVSLLESHITQEFRTEFIWSNAPAGNTVLKDGLPERSNETSIEDFLYLRKLPRSGNPGYVVGKPLILGRKVLMIVQSGNETDGEKKYVEKMQVIPDESQWLLTQAFGYCGRNQSEIESQQRNQILFGYDQISSCSMELDLFQDCNQLQRQINSVIFGSSGIDSMHYVAAYGSPDAFPGDWVKLNYDEVQSMVYSTSPGSSTISMGCRGIINAVHITISYAHVGPVDSPQAKITGIFFQPEESIIIPEKSNEPGVKHLPVTTTVTFLDVTGKPTTRVATFPVVSVQLPADFFYPFSSSSMGPSSGASRSDRDLWVMPSSISLILLVVGTYIL